jgi:alkylation response protein AidB-like acyl-CoA dehydrogenase
MTAPAFTLGAILRNLSTLSLAVADDAIFPSEAMRRLEDAGALRVPLPKAVGGLGIGTETGQGEALLTFLHAIGRISLPLGRLIEAHINALRIVARYGAPDQMARVAQAVAGGALFGLWVTDPPGDAGLRMRLNQAGLTLTGGKMFCSGAGHVDWAVVTAFDDGCDDDRLLLVPLNGSEKTGAMAAGLAGMKAAVTGQVDFTGRSLGPEAEIGLPGDYLKEPDFSGGAWRSSAVALGGLAALIDLTCAQLTVRGRGDDPHQRARFGQMVMAHETGRLWLRHAGTLAENLEAPAEDIVAAVGLARLAVERACLESIEAAHRSLGISAFLQSNPVERLTRDLQTYLRQPAGDEVLHKAAGHFMALGLPKL